MITTIPLLLGSCGPTAIVRFIIAEWIRMSIDALPYRPDAHVSQEVFKLPPAFADRNADGSVFFVIFRFWIKTAIFHATPRGVCPRFASASGAIVAVRCPRMTVCSVPDPKPQATKFAAKATAATRLFLNQASPRDRSFGAASTTTVPVKINLSRVPANVDLVGKTNNCPSVEYLASAIDSHLTNQYREHTYLSMARKCN